MHRTMATLKHPLLALAALWALSACDHVADTSHVAADMVHRTYEDARTTWSDVFTYHPPKPPQMAQTRYCYQMQSDVVCYDSVQPGLTSKLVGYQDGEANGWFQPGGGSTGASGGAAVALGGTTVQTATTYGSTNYGPIHGNSSTIETTRTVDIPGQGQISTQSLPPVRDTGPVTH